MYTIDVCKCLTEGILGLGGRLGLEGLGLALGVDGPDPELVLLALSQPGNLSLGALADKNTTRYYNNVEGNPGI